MDVEKMAMCAGVGFALGIGAFVLWGPSPKPRRRGQIAGITNLGHTCFLNSLLQAFAATSIFKDWLDERRKGKSKSATFANELASVLDKINGSDEDLYGNVAPIQVITSLGSLWRFGPGHQDAHELFHVILSALRSETRTAASRRGCLSDALPAGLNDPADTNLTTDPQRLRSVSCNDIAWIRRKSVAKKDELVISPTRSILNGHGPDKPGIVISRSADIICEEERKERLTDGGSFGIRSWLRAIPPSGISAIANNETHPFSGLLTSQLRCANCKWKSPVRYDKLESVSLPLPPAGGPLTWKRHTLSELLSRLVTSEVIPNVECDGCSSRCPAVKTLTLGKLPRCLCLHIPRTTWSDSGIPIKRDDPVIFPEMLILDPFTFAEATKRNSQSETRSMLFTDRRNVLEGEASGGKHRYRLEAVVEHRGPVDAGHFVCYRRGNRKGRWIYTSDTTIDDTSLTNVLCASPYLLFYQRIDRASS